MSITFERRTIGGDLRTLAGPLVLLSVLLVVTALALPAPAAGADGGDGAAGAAATTAATDGDTATGRSYEELVPAPDPLPQSPIVDITPTEVDLTFPVADPDHGVSFRDDFLALRGGGSRLHAATDVMAPKHRPIYAAVGGTITFAPYDPGREGWSELGEPPYGWMISIRGDDGRRYSYVHLNNDTPARTPGPDGEVDDTSAWLDDDAGGMQHAYAPRIVAAIEQQGTARGLRVERGEHIGWNGDSGNAKGVAPHLHFEIEVTGPDGPYRINPYHSLEAALQRGDVPDVPAPATTEEEEKKEKEEEEQQQDKPVDPTPKPEPTYSDVDPKNVHAAAIEQLAADGILGGCDTDRFCPAALMRRGDLAVAMAAALDLDVDAPGSSRFPDVDADDARDAAIAAVDAAGILTGYADGSFGADDGLTRAQLASVLVRGFGVPPAAKSAGFSDVVPGSTHSEAIDALAAAGVTRGCSDGARFCGGEVERRDRVASFLQRGRGFEPR